MATSAVLRDDELSCQIRGNIMSILINDAQMPFMRSRFRRLGSKSHYYRSLEDKRRFGSPNALYSSSEETERAIGMRCCCLTEHTHNVHGQPSLVRSGGESRNQCRTPRELSNVLFVSAMSYSITSIIERQGVSLEAQCAIRDSPAGVVH